MRNDSDMKNWTLLLKEVESLAKKASRLILDADLKTSSIAKKGRIDLVTDVDIAVNSLLCNELAALDKSFDIVAEEGTPKNLSQKNARFAWVIDPIDGTTNFVHGLKHSAMSIALYDRMNQESVVGLVYNPFREECFTAVKEGGAHLNNVALKTSSTIELVDSLVCTGFAYDVNAGQDNNLAEFSSIIKQVQGLRRFGAASLDLAYVACGRFDGYFEHGLKFWDYAAGMLLVLESGGKASEYDSKKVTKSSGHILATNQHIHEKMRKAIKKARSDAGLTEIPVKS
jgi:myo-inositol-1(or 4)-monophosphatase